jgi:hypothetical protein
MDVGSETPNPETSQTGSWVVQTTTGKLLPPTDLATLHRWIVERRVGRDDLLSRNDQGGQRLGDIAELLPFFEIVDSAERARVQAMPAEAPLPPPLAVPVLQPPLATPRTTSAQSSGAMPAVGAERDQTVIIRVGSKRSLGFVKVLVAGGVAAVVAYFGILWQHRQLVPPSVPMAVEQAAPARPVVAKVEEAPEPAVVPPEEADDTSIEPAPAHGTGARPNGLAKARSIPRSKGSAAGVGTPEQLRVEGSTAEPNTPQALAAQGYVALQRKNYIQAIRFFRLALMTNPPNGTALFGLAESYRASGQHAAALRAYRRYVELMPNGPDAAQTRAHLRALEGKGR